MSQYWIDLISKTNNISYEDMVCLPTAIKYNYYDLLTKLIDKGINLNEGVIHVIRNQNKKMFNFFMEKGCDITDDAIVVEIFQNLQNDNFFEHVIDFYSYSDIDIILSKFPLFIRNCNLYKLKILINKGLILDKINFEEIHINGSTLCKSISCCSADDMDFMIRNGLKLTNNLLIYPAQRNNIETIDRLLNYGLVFDKHVIYHLLKTDDIGDKISILKTLLKYDCDYSLILINEESTDNYNWSNDFLNKGLNPETIVNFLFW